MFLPQEIIRRKRDGHTLSSDEIRFMVQGMTDGSVKNEQVSALAMAIFFRKMQREERNHESEKRRADIIVSVPGTHRAIMTPQ